MRGVGHELPLLREGVLQPVQHAVEGGRQPAHLVVARGRSQAARQVSGLDAPRRAGDMIDRRERPSGEKDAAGGRHREESWDGEEEQREEFAQRVPHPIEGLDRLDGAGRSPLTVQDASHVEAYVPQGRVALPAPQGQGQEVGLRGQIALTEDAAA